ncbi:MAG: hypothetical protein LBH58_02060 [Tannerellaceae bacterium]|jgi:uncharacterized membrane protein YfcA|nr:hypothetical protein [Tannerellaceae bacterium]
MNNNLKNRGLTLIVIGAILAILGCALLFFSSNDLPHELIGAGLALIAVGLFLVRPQKKEVIPFK